MTARLPPQPGEWIDRSRPISFKFEGTSYTGFAGDTVTSALAANGVKLLGRSFKYHRPRGVYSLANHDVNMMAEDRGQTNIRGDVTPLWEGAELKAVNTFGGLARDWVARWIGPCAKMLPVGFYYKAFHSPRRLFPFYERQMRQMAGLGAVDRNRPRKHSPERFDFCDVLVIGAGPSGWAAAIAAAEAGAKVVLVDEQQRPGGSLNYLGSSDTNAADLRSSLTSHTASLSNLDVRPATVAAGYYADHWIALVDAERLTKMRARAVVVTTGCFEQPAVFGNNDLPGVMLATAAQRLVHQYAVKPFERAVILTANADGYRAALDLKRPGVQVAAIVDLRPQGEPSELGEQVERAGITIHRGHTVTRAISGGDGLGIAEAHVCPLDGSGRPVVGKGFDIAADGLLMSVGWAAADGLFYQAGGRMTWSDTLQQFIPKSAPPGTFAAGRLNGVHGLDERIADGRRAGEAAAAYLGLRPPPTNGEPVRPTVSPSHPFPIFPDDRTKSFVDLDEDVHYHDIVNAAQEGFDQVELLKRYSTFGMGPSQGKLANINAIRVLARVKKQTVPETGVTTARPFFHPVPLGHLAGRGFHPHRYTPLDSRHQKAGAVFMPAGDWRRPAYYAIAGKTPEAVVAEEVTAVRQSVGMIDVGTLGKLEISGPDAAEFVERIYTGKFANLKVGAGRYALMCDESGVIIDDGLVARLAEDRFYVTTTTTASGPVYREMQRWAILWGLKVVLANLTGANAAINLAGSRSREILGELCNLDLSQSAFPYMGLREGQIAGAPARLIRVGFVGECGYEIHLPAYYAASVWDRLLEAGQRFGIRPFGVEAQRILRLEKAHVIISQDTDGLTNPFEANMAWAVKSDKPFFVGGRSLQILKRKPRTRVLVGFTLAKDRPSSAPMPKECHLIIEQGEIVGRVTSITRSPTLRQVIGLAFVRPERAKPGTNFQIRIDDGSMIHATVVETPFYDPGNTRQNST
jgi:sarcosine oxidase subunit alpha